jgi:hypothetical protein
MYGEAVVTLFGETPCNKTLILWMERHDAIANVMCTMDLMQLRTMGARRRRSGGGPGGGCARMPVGTYPHLLVAGAGNYIAVSRMARLGARRGETRQLRSVRSVAVGKPRYGGRLKLQSIHYQRQYLPLGPSDVFFKTIYSQDTVPFWGLGAVSQECVEARRVRPDHRWNVCVGAGRGSREATPW